MNTLTLADALFKRIWIASAFERKTVTGYSFHSKYSPMLRTATITTFLTLFFTPIFSQEKDENFKTSSAKNYWGISVIPLSVAKTKIYGDKAKYQLHSRSQFGIEALFSYYYNIEKNYALVFSAGVNALSSRLYYTIPKEMFDPPTESDVKSNKFSSGLGLYNYKVQVEFLRRWHARKINIWNLGGGVSLLYADANGGETGEIHVSANGQSERHLTRFHKGGNDGKPWLNFHVSGGPMLILRSGDMLQVLLKMNYSPTNFLTGTYHFNVGNQPELSGQYKASGSYIGISIAYIFTGGS